MKTNPYGRNMVKNDPDSIVAEKLGRNEQYCVNPYTCANNQTWATDGCNLEFGCLIDSCKQINDTLPRTQDYWNTWPGHVTQYQNCTVTVLWRSMLYNMWPSLTKRWTSRKAHVFQFTCTVAGIGAGINVTNIVLTHTFNQHLILPN